MRDAENMKYEIWNMEIWLSLFSYVALKVIVSQSFHFHDFFPLPVPDFFNCIFKISANGLWANQKCQFFC